MRMRAMRWLGHLSLLSVAGCATPEVVPVLRVDAVLPESAYRALPTLTLSDIRAACDAVARDLCSIGVAEGAVGPMGAVAFWGVDGKRTQLYRVDTAGTVTRLGRLGGGPGEYRFGGAMGFDGRGNLALADLPQRRLTTFGADGAVVATQELPFPVGLFHIEFASGAPVAIATDLPRNKGDSAAVHEYVLDVMRKQPVRRRTLAFKRPSYAVSDLRPVPPAFSAHDHFGHLADGTLLHTSGREFVIDEYDAHGVITRRFGFEVNGRVVTDGELEASRRRALARVGDPRMRAAMQASMRESGRAARHPAITRLVVLGSMGLAIRQAPRVEGDSVTWVVYRGPALPTGRLVLGVDDRILGAFDGRLLVAFDREEAGSGLHWGRLDTLAQPRSP